MAENLVYSVGSLIDSFTKGLDMGNCQYRAEVVVVQLSRLSSIMQCSVPNSALELTFSFSV